MSVSIDFQSNSKWDAPSHGIPYDYSHADWDVLCDHLRNVPWDDIFELIVSASYNEFCEWVQVGIDAYILIINIRSSLIYFCGFQLCCSS